MKSTCTHSEAAKAPYDIWSADTSTRLYRNEMLRYAHLLRLFPVLKKGRVLDVGCGTGYMSYLLSKKNLSVTAIDISEQSMALFKNIAVQYNIVQIKADLFSLTLNGFDALISQEVLEHIENYKAALKHMSTYLKHNGLALFCVPYKENLAAKTMKCAECGQSYHINGHLHHFTEDNFTKSIENNHFNILKIRRITNKRTIKWLTMFNLPVNNFSIAFDRMMNILFPRKAAYLAILAEKAD